MAKDVERRSDSPFEVLKAATTPQARFEAGQYAMGVVPVEGDHRGAPRFFYDLPWADDNKETVAAIVAQLAASEDIAAATQTKELRKATEVVDLPMTVLGLAVRTPAVED